MGGFPDPLTGFEVAASWRGQRERRGGDRKGGEGREGAVMLSSWIALDWIEQCFTSPPSIGYMGDGFYRSKDPTNSIKVLKVYSVSQKIPPMVF